MYFGFERGFFGGVEATDAYLFFLDVTLDDRRNLIILEPLKGEQQALQQSFSKSRFLHAAC